MSATIFIVAMAGYEGVNDIQAFADKEDAEKLVAELKAHMAIQPQYPDVCAPDKEWDKAGRKIKKWKKKCPGIKGTGELLCGSGDEPIVFELECFD